MSTEYEVGSRVIHKAHPEYGFGVIRYIEEDAFGDLRYQVSFDHVLQNITVPPGGLKLLPKTLDLLNSQSFESVEIFNRKLSAGLVLGENNRTGAFIQAAIQPLPHQAYILEKVFSNGRMGHILADDVGLGKTIEAGLIITASRHSDKELRVLVVCPAGLALQWQDEMEDNFSLFFSIMGVDFDGKRLGGWQNRNMVIAPIDRMKREDYRDILKNIGMFDLVICDEAHRLNASRNIMSNDLEKTANYKLFEFLLESGLIDYVRGANYEPRSPKLLLLTATPHQGDNLRFLHLLHLARPDLYVLDEKKITEQLSQENLIETLTRTPKSEAVGWDGKPIFKGHVTHTIDISWTEEELDLSRKLTKYIKKSLEGEYATKNHNQLVVELVMHTFHKIAASSWFALKETMKNRRFQLTGQSSLNKLPSDDGEVQESTSLLIPGKQFFDDELKLLDDIIDSINLLVSDSKWELFVKLMDSISKHKKNEKLLIFTQYRATQDMLISQLKAAYSKESIECINGDISMDGRREARARFEKGSRFLVSTEAGGEGINLQKKCHILVNYDLPWNPMRLQQRVGRLDRYGQTHIVDVYNLRVENSWDQRISTRIIERLDVIQSTMDKAIDGVEDYKEMILGTIAEDINPTKLFAKQYASLQTGLSDAEIDTRIQRAMDSVKKWNSLVHKSLGMPVEQIHSHCRLTSDHLRTAYEKSLLNHEISLQSTRTEENKFIPDVYHFKIPDKFKTKSLRASKDCYVVFSRERFEEVRNEVIGRVRGQDIRPQLAGFGDPFTDWLFSCSFLADDNESSFCITPPKEWDRGSGIVFVYALGWMGGSRRLNAPDSLCVVFVPNNGDAVSLPPEESMVLVSSQDGVSSYPYLDICDTAGQSALTLARKELKDIAEHRDQRSRSTASISLLMAAQVCGAMEAAQQGHQGYS